jgi:hypothetical protein
MVNVGFSRSKLDWIYNELYKAYRLFFEGYDIQIWYSDDYNHYTEVRIDNTVFETFSLPSVSPRNEIDKILLMDEKELILYIRKYKLKKYLEKDG